MRGNTGSFLVEPFAACLDLLETLGGKEDGGGERGSDLLVDVHLVLCSEVALSNWIFLVVEGTQLGGVWILSLVLGLLFDLQRRSFVQVLCILLACCSSGAISCRRKVFLS